MIAATMIKQWPPVLGIIEIQHPPDHDHMIAGVVPRLDLTLKVRQRFLKCRT